MSKVVVTGGAGFIGSHLAAELVRRRHEVIVIDNLATGRFSNIEPVLAERNIQFKRGSIADLPLLRKLFAGADYVFHQAAIPSVPRSVKNPRQSHAANMTGTLNVLLAARDNGVRKVVYASSSAVYGDIPTLPKIEDMATAPQSPYAVAKLAGEYYCRVFHEIYGLETACLRYFNVYGPRQDPDSPYAAVIPLFITRALAGKAPVIFGDGEQSRDFVFVGDVVAANILAAEGPMTGVFNIGSGEAVTINGLTRLVLDLTGNAGLKPVYREARAGDVKHSLADIARARAFGFNPRFRLEDGLPEVIKYLKK